MTQDTQTPGARAGSWASMAAYARGVRAEGRKVTWPTRAETLATTGAVGVMVVVASVFLFTADQAMAWVVRMVLSLGM
jgi:preprotein translocase subunit SecE